MKTKKINWIPVEDIKKSSKECTFINQENILEYIFSYIGKNRNLIYEKLLISLFESLSFSRKKKILREFGYVPYDYTLKFKRYELFVDDIIKILSETNHYCESILVLVNQKRIIFSGFLEWLDNKVISRISGIHGISIVHHTPDNKIKIELQEDHPLRSVLSLQESNINLTLIKTLKNES